MSSLLDDPLATTAAAAAAEDPAAYGSAEAPPPGDWSAAGGYPGDPQCAATSECGGDDTAAGYGTTPAGGR